MKQGFTLIEVILATALASMISVALIFMTQQMSGTLMRVDRISDLYMRASLLQHQMERDIAGAFAPTDFSATDTAGVEKKNRPKKIEKIFWGDNTLETLTFITNNPLQSYWGERSGKAQPKIVRVVYRLVPDTKRANVYTLMRQEGSDLNLESYTTDPSILRQAQDERVGRTDSTRAYPMIEGIRSIQIDYTTLIKKESSTADKQTPPQTAPTETSEEQPEQKSEEEFERKTVQEWKNNIEDQKPPWPLIPQFVTMHVILWDNTFKRTTPFTFEFQILPRFEKADQKQVEEKKTSGFGIGQILGQGLPS